MKERNRYGALSEVENVDVDGIVWKKMTSFTSDYHDYFFEDGEISAQVFACSSGGQGPAYLSDVSFEGKSGPMFFANGWISVDRENVKEVQEQMLRFLTAEIKKAK